MSGPRASRVRYNGFMRVLASGAGGLWAEDWWVYVVFGLALLAAAWAAATRDVSSSEADTALGEEHEPRAPILGVRLASGADLLVSAAALTLGAGAIHFAVIRAHFDESALFGLFFVVTALLQIGWSLAVALVPSRSLLLAGAAGNAGIVLVWLASRTTGLPVGPEPWKREAVGSLDLFATAFEVLAIYLTLSLLSAAPAPRRLTGLSAAPAALTLTVLLVVAGLVLAGGH